MKRCYHCKTSKALTEFYGDKYTKDGVKSCCKECTKERTKTWRDQNPQKAREGIYRWRAKNREYWNDYCKHWHGRIDAFSLKGQRQGRHREEARQYIKDWKAQYDVENRDRNSAYHKEQTKLPGFRDRVNCRQRKRRAMDVSYRIGCAFRGRVTQALREQNVLKTRATMSLIGCSRDEFRSWLEMNMEPWMTWENYGFGTDKWNIDHWNPCSSFDLEDPDQLAACFHWSNQYPCWQIENLRKGGKILGPLSPERQAKVTAFAGALEKAA